MCQGWTEEFVALDLPQVPLSQVDRPGLSSYLYDLSTGMVRHVGTYREFEVTRNKEEDFDSQHFFFILISFRSVSIVGPTSLEVLFRVT